MQERAHGKLGYSMLTPPYMMSEQNYVYSE